MPSEQVPLSRLVEDPSNARRHPTYNLDAIRVSLRRFGQVEPLVVQRSTGVVLGGNGRLAVMRELGWTECSVVYVDLSDIEAKRLALTLNRSAELATWDMSALAGVLAELGEVQEIGLDGLKEIGFSAKDLDKIAVREHTRSPKQKASEPPPIVVHTCPKCGTEF